MSLVVLMLSMLSLLPFPGSSLFAVPVTQGGHSYDDIRRSGETAYAEGSWSRAHDAYALADLSALTAEQRRWTRFRLADTLWRSEASNSGADTTKLEAAREELDALNREAGTEHDRVWAEMQESLGDLVSKEPRVASGHDAATSYHAAADWWAGSDDLERARERYLGLVAKLAPHHEGSQRYWNYGSSVTIAELDNAARLARTPAERSRFHYLLALQLQSGGDAAARERVATEFEKAIAEGRTADWYDDALFRYAQWLEQGGRVVVSDDGTIHYEADYVKALELYNRILAQFKQGESAYYDQAKSASENLSTPAVNVAVSNVFLPGSETQFMLGWRNVSRVALTLTPVDLTSNVQWENGVDWEGAVRPSGSAVRTWTKETGDDGRHVPGRDDVRIEPKLPAGAYLLEARAGSATSKALLLVTDAAVVTRTSGSKIVVFVCDAVSGAPLPRARVTVAHSRNGSNWENYHGDTGADGLLQLPFRNTEWGQVHVAAALGSAHQAIAQTYKNGSGRDEADSWNIYAFTDRPAYRPKETVQWKFFARAHRGELYENRPGAVIRFEIFDPRGAKVTEGSSTLNAFGSAWGSLDLTEAMPLGEYNIRFFGPDKRQIGFAQLFRLEEYKLPEFKVEVHTPEVNGARRIFRLGDTVEASIEASYFFGGPVAGAKVEAVVHQQPWQRWWWEDSPYPWLYADTMHGRRGGDNIIKREELTTDAEGHAVIRFETPADGSDMEYRIEARVIDASRREITGSGSVRVMKQRYTVQANPKHWITRPGEKATVDFKAIDANDNPVHTTGSVKITREWWEEVWIDPQGHELRGAELQRVRSSMALFPPRPKDPCGWHIKSRGYNHEDVTTLTATTDAAGEASVTFTPQKDGYYRVSWSSPDRDASAGGPLRTRDFVKSETTLWVASSASTDIGYVHEGGVELIVDKAAFRTGQRAPVMIVTPASGRYVLFSIDGNDMISNEVVHMDGTAKLMEIALDEKHVPNFYVTATTVADLQASQDQKEIVVPPVSNFIDVSVKPEREEYQPREDGTITVTTKDADGKPVAAEVALGVADESVYSIQSELAMDPRQFFFGTKRYPTVQTANSFQRAPYVRLVEFKNRLVDERQLAELEAAAETARNTVDALDEDTGGMEGGVVGGVVGGVIGGAPPPPAPMSAPMVAQGSMANAARQMSKSESVSAKDIAVQAPEEAQTAVQVRNDFRSTIFWQPDVITGRDGTATIKFPYPDALTTWRATARAVSAGNQFGMGTSTTRTKKPLIVRLQGPRFFVVGDEVVLSAVVNNNTDSAMSVMPSLDVEGLVVKGAGVDGSGGQAKALEVPAHGEARSDWRVIAARSGQAKLTVTARGAKQSDAMEKSFPVYDHGIDKLVAHSGKLRGSEAVIKLELPARRPGSTVMTVQVAPSIAVTMLDALPYLIEYPYGCTEQTMSRFLPAAVVARTLQRLGLDAGDIAGHLFGGIEQANAKKTHSVAPRDLDELNKVTSSSMKRLYDFQHGDGGWGWWKDGDSDAWMTAYVVWGFAIAREGGLAVDVSAVNRAAAWLDKKLVMSERSYDSQAWMLHALAAWNGPSSSPLRDKAVANVWLHRDDLTSYSRALFALALEDGGDHTRALTLIRNLESGVKRDAAPDNSVLLHGAAGRETTAAETMATAHWGEDGFWWRWSQGPVESTSFALQALMRIDPKNALVEPAMNWLVKNRRGAQWNNTRDTAIALLALNDYLKTSGELNSEMTYELRVNGTSVATRTVHSADVLRAPSRFVIDPSLVRDGGNEIRITKTSTAGSSALYFSAEARFFSLEEPVKAAGNELFVRRDYYRLAPHSTLLKGTVYDREPLHDLGSLVSDERVDVVLTIETKNDYEYLLFEDLKPAGLEAIELQSGNGIFATELKSGAVTKKFVERKGPVAQKVSAIQQVSGSESTGRSAWVYRELRDRKIALFIDHLPQGVWEIHYSLRAEVPGSFHALPLMGQAMYVPEIRANGEEVRLVVTDAP